MGDSTKKQTEEELERLVRMLGGGWGWDQGVMPYIKLTLPEAQALEERFPEGKLFKDPTDELHYNIVRAEQHTRQAHNLLYLEDGPKRSIWYKTALGRAQSILMTLWKRELRWKS